MKIRTYKRRISHMLHWYTEEISRRLPNMNYMSMANRYRAESTLNQIQNEKVHFEPQVLEWQCKLNLTYLEDETGRVNAHVVLDPEWEKENVLVLDFDAT